MRLSKAEGNPVGSNPVGFKHSKTKILRTRFLASPLAPRDTDAHAPPSSVSRTPPNDMAGGTEPRAGAGPLR